MNSATPQDTQDHMLGSGALSWDWWRNEVTVNADTPDWESVLTIEGEDENISFTIRHSTIMRIARKIIRNKPEYASDELVRQCRNLVFNADETDFDASSADELLQVTVFGKVVYG